MTEIEQPKSRNEYFRKYMAERRAAGRDIGEVLEKSICGIDWKRRRRCAKDPERFCRTYFPHIFFNPFSGDQKTIIRAITERTHQGGYQAIAAERGGGKSTIIKVVCGVYAIVYGHLKFLILIGANNPFAESMLADIKSFYEFNDLLAQDFPEVCVPIRALDGAAQKAKGQLCFGERTRMTWSAKEIIFPTVKLDKHPTVANGAVIITRGIDSPIRGIVKAEKRPDLVICDDLEDRESVKSKIETEKRELTLTSDILGLAGPDKRLAVLMLGTIMQRGCIIDKYTDIIIHPEWNGIRQQRLIRKPDREDLWEKYIELRKQDQRKGDDSGRTAFYFYKANKKIMDAGAQVSNEHRYYKHLCSDGSPYEISALQSCYNAIADMGLEAFQTEFQNDPPVDELEASKLEYYMISERVNGLDRGVKPADAEYVTGFIDVHSDRLFWAVTAWEKNLIGYVMDYGAERIDTPIRGTISDGDMQDQIIVNIRKALESLTASLPDVDLGFIDAGYMPEAVYAFVRSQQKSVWRPSIGGSSRAGGYRSPKPSRYVRQIGAGYHESFLTDFKLWLTIFDPNKFKFLAQEGFRTSGRQPGSITLFGDEPTTHKVFGEHIASEVYNPERRAFEVISKNNHWLDCMAGNVLAAMRLGGGLIKTEKRPPIRLSEKPRRKL